MALEPGERRFHYFSGYVLFSEMEEAITKAMFISSTNQLPRRGSEQLVGFAFFPKKEFFDNLTSFETTGLELKLVVMGSDSLHPSSFSFLDAIIDDTGGLVNVETTITDTIDLSAYLVGASAEESFNLLMNYNQSREFELAYLDYDSYILFKSSFSAATNPGIAFTRASVSMPTIESPTAQNYTNYRTLKFTPKGLSNTGLTPGGLDDVAYKVAPPCPPIWDTSAQNSGGPNNLLRPVSHSTESNLKDDPSGSSEAPHCGCNVPPTAIRAAMINQGIIRDEFTAPTNVLRYILIRTLLWALIIGLAVGVSWWLFTGKGEG